jgi:hypothetical protein
MNKLFIIELSNRLNTYYGRDTSLRLIQYLTLLIHGVLEIVNYKTNNSSPFLSCAKQFSNCRLIMRFFDDLPAITKLYNYYIETKSIQNIVCKI